jgi:DNA (cytosine-5)-methyltransferase 1
MRYLSVCSGIEAASVAWHHLGWEPVGFSEIEPFPAAVLKHRFPHVPNYGDMTKFEEWPIEPGTVDLLVGGTPCQSFSVAGLRKGLEDPRGNLMLTYLAIAARLQPRWVVWENVPGVLSSNRGRDFGTFLSALGQLGYGIAYRVLDAQYVRVGKWPRAVPQRRRRVFVVGCLGDWTAAAEVLAVREGLQRHLEAGGKARQGAASDAEGGARGGCWWDGGQVSQTLDAVLSKGQTMPEKNRFPAVLQPTAYRWQNDALGLQQDDAVAALRASAGSSGFHEMNHPVIAQPVPFTKAKRAQSVTDDETWVQGQVNPTLSLFDQGDTRATTVAVSVDLQNVNMGGDVAGTLDTTRPSRGGGQAVAFPIDTQNMTEGHSSGGLGFGKSDDPSFTVTKGHSHAVAHAFYSTGGTHGVNQHPEVSPAVKVGSGLGIPSPPAVAFTVGNAARGQGPGPNTEVFPTLKSGGGRGTDDQWPSVMTAMTVRRLTPVECERLQGFPDNWTLIPWRKKPASECPDGPRYKALGNSMACNCMAWIGERIAKWEADHA